MSLSGFHPAIERWFESRFRDPTEPQQRAWPLIQAGRNALIAAPTGSGKTFAAFLAAIDSLLRQGLDGTLTDGTQVVYVSPLKALSNDVQKNLANRWPRSAARSKRCACRCGDPHAGAHRRYAGRGASGDGAAAPAHSRHHTRIALFDSHLRAGPRNAARRAHGDRGRDPRRGARQAGEPPGAVARGGLEHLTGRRLQRIGLSATQKPIEDIAAFLTGTRHPTPDTCIIDSGHARTLDLALEIPSSPLRAVMAAEVWDEIYERLVQLILEHRTTLVIREHSSLAERSRCISPSGWARIR